MTKYRSSVEPGTTSWALRKARWRALGISESDMEKPKIAITDSSSELSICFSHLDEMAAMVEQAAREAGGRRLKTRPPRRVTLSPEPAAAAVT